MYSANRNLFLLLALTFPGAGLMAQSPTNTAPVSLAPAAVPAPAIPASTNVVPPPPRGEGEHGPGGPEGRGDHDGRPWRGHGDEGGGSSLEGQMKIMARGMRQLSQQVTDSAKQQDTLVLIGKLRKAVTDSKALDPRMTATVPPADKEKFLTAYRAEMDKLNDAFAKIEDAVKSGQYDQAKAQLPSIKSIQGEGHRQFKED